MPTLDADIDATIQKRSASFIPPRRDFAPGRFHPGNTGQRS